jgi:hypothetical protein
MLRRVVDIEIVEIGPFIGLMTGERHHDVDKEADPVAMAGLDERGKVRIGSRGDLAVGEAQFPIGREKVGRVVAPRAFEKAVRRRQQFESVDSQFGEIGAAGAENVQSFEIGASGGFIDQGQHILERPDRPLVRPHALRARPRGRQLINDQMVVGGQSVGFRIGGKGCRLAARIDRRKAAALKANDGRGLTVSGVIEAGAQRRREQTPIDRGRERVGAEDQALRRLAGIRVFNLKPVVINAVG